MRRVLLVCAALAACGSALDPQPVPPEPPPSPPLVSCPPSVESPALLPGVVTTDRLRNGFRLLELARRAERARGDACAEAVRRLHQWIKDHAA